MKIQCIHVNKLLDKRKMLEFSIIIIIIIITK
jgi:hypothetical protein